MPLVSTFDNTFDLTFQNAVSSGSITVAACQANGINMTWLTDTGWAFFLFQGNADIDLQVASVGQFEKGYLEQDTQKLRGNVVTLRTKGLTYQDAEIVSTIYGSPRVFAFVRKGATEQLVPVRIEPGTFAKWREKNKRLGLEVKVVFPKRPSQLV